MWPWCRVSRSGVANVFGAWLAVAEADAVVDDVEDEDRWRTGALDMSVVKQWGTA